MHVTWNSTRYKVPLQPGVEFGYGMRIKLPFLRALRLVRFLGSARRVSAGKMSNGRVFKALGGTLYRMRAFEAEKIDRARALYL